jgi:hypothetical protein
LPPSRLRIEVLLPMIVAFPSRRAPAGKTRAPERRRVVVIGADAAGITAALHVGEHSLLLEKRMHVGATSRDQQVQGGFDDRKSTLALGASRAGFAGAQDTGADRNRQGVSTWERREVAAACTPDHRQAGGETPEVRHSLNDPGAVSRWIPPRLDPVDEGTCPDSRQSLQGMLPLLRGELRLGARVTRIVPLARTIELADGSSIIYDKLISSIQAIELTGLLQPQLPNRIRTHQGLLYWLTARDVELIDESTQFLFGDVDPFAAGRRIAQTVKRALAQKFRPESETFLPGAKLFEPRLVQSPPPSAVAH